MLLFYLFLVVSFILMAILIHTILRYGDSLDEPHVCNDVDYLQSRYSHSDDLGKSILALIDDVYSPFSPVRLCDHLLSDLDIDSLDMVDLLYDLEHISGAKLNASGLYKLYGRNPTVAQLIAYVRHALDTQHPQSP